MPRLMARNSSTKGAARASRRSTRACQSHNQMLTQMQLLLKTNRNHSERVMHSRTYRCQKWNNPRQSSKANAAVQKLSKDLLHRLQCHLVPMALGNEATSLGARSLCCLHLPRVW